jgi:hypothetical protein
MMATYYPTTMEELLPDSGRGQGKARKFGAPFPRADQELL